MKIFLPLAALAASLSLHPAAAQTGSSTGGKSNGESSSSKPQGKNIITRSGGQGHNNTKVPKGKILVAPTTPPAHSGKRTGSLNAPMN
ncbi:MAG: hypothetical protein ACRYG7_40870 [Janthinobacterium lividum]